MILYIPINLEKNIVSFLTNFIHNILRQHENLSLFLPFDGYNHMQMVAHQCPRIDIESLVLLAICERVNHDMLVSGSGEDVHPVHNRCSHEVEFR